MEKSLFFGSFVALALAACSSGGGTGSSPSVPAVATPAPVAAVSITPVAPAQVASVNVLSVPQQVGTSDSQSLYALASVPAVDTPYGSAALAYYGSVDASGNAAQVSQIAVGFVANPQMNAHVFVNASSQITKVVVDQSGAAVVASYPSSSQVMLSMCGSDGTLQQELAEDISNGISVTPSHLGRCGISAASSSRGSAGTRRAKDLAALLGIVADPFFYPPAPSGLLPDAYVSAMAAGAVAESVSAGVATATATPITALPAGVPAFSPSSAFSNPSPVACKNPLPRSGDPNDPTCNQATQGS